MAKTSWFDERAQHPTLHEQVTSVMIELTAYNVMRLLHELQTDRARTAFAKS
jgi:hypothetical protein